MLNYEEELKKFKPCLDVDEVEDAIYSRDLTDVIDRIKALKDADVAYDNYSGLAKGSSGEVRFVIETDAIEK